MHFLCKNRWILVFQGIKSLLFNKNYFHHKRGFFIFVTEAPSKYFFFFRPSVVFSSYVIANHFSSLFFKVWSRFAKPSWFIFLLVSIPLPLLLWYIIGLWSFILIVSSLGYPSHRSFLRWWLQRHSKSASLYLCLIKGAFFVLITTT